MRRGKPESQTKIARERMELLIREAAKRADEPALARRYVTLLRKIGMRYNVKIPKEIRRQFCKHCNSYITTARVRVKSKAITVTCGNCKKITRIPTGKRTQA